MALIVDSENVINSLASAPDKLRAEVGRYFAPDLFANANNPGPYSGFSNFRSGIKSETINLLEESENQLIPNQRYRIFFSGREDQFRDQIQWNEYVKQTVAENIAYLDHQFSFDPPEITNEMIKNFHNPEYEDNTKTYGSNQLLNYNLISYPFKDQVNSKLQSLADIRTEFDDESYFVNSEEALSNLFNQFENRLSNYSGSVEEISLKQRNIFDLFGGTIMSFFSTPLVPLERFPFYYHKNLPLIGSNTNNFEFNNILNIYKKRLNIFKGIKESLYFSNRNFNVGTDIVSGQIYNLIDMITSTRILSFIEQTDETIMPPGDMLDYNDSSRRFADQINTVRFISRMRNLMKTNQSGGKARTLSDIFNATPSENFFLGYKIEKYLNNDAGRPIQTYYTNSRNFYDTQMKYGRRYIYKTKILIGILGSSYTYSDLKISQNETEMMSPNGELVESLPQGYANISSEKYRGYVDVAVTPSFQILEYQVDEDEVAFVDQRTLPPQIDFFNDSKRASVQFFLSPMFANIEEQQVSDQNVIPNPYRPLSEEDKRIQELIKISKNDNESSDYFTGIYEVYRSSTPPDTELDFLNRFLISVDDKTSLAYPDSMAVAPPEFPLDNMSGYFEDFIIPNVKYYYAFRALTYHGTPSNLSMPFEVELLQDSDEYKVNVSQYKYPTQGRKRFEKPAKRIIRINPNIQRLEFSETELLSSSSVRYKLDNGTMLTKGVPSKFKIRITSKHTGKKIDINLNLILNEDDSFNQN